MPQSQQDFELLKKTLESRREQLLQELGSQLIKTGDKDFISVAGRVRDLGDDSVADLIADLDIAHIEKETEEIRDVETALDRMRRGSYGQCIDCGQQIKFERLQANPTSKRCIECQSLQEESHGKGDITHSL